MSKIPTSKKTKESKPVLLISFIIGLIILVFYIYHDVLNAGITNWDDKNYILNNGIIKDFSFSNILKMFSVYIMGNYHPLTILSYAAEYSLWGINTKMFHLTNLLFHILNSILAFFIVYQITRKNLLFAVFVSLLFAVHPMHIESVAWISARKDLLYVFFFFASMLTYIKYSEKQDIKYLLLTLLLFVFSLLSKGQAVVLPVVLLLIDYVLNRKFSSRLFVEKIPFFAVSLVFGVVAYFAQQSVSAVNLIHLEKFQNILFGFYGLSLYIIKSVFPYQLSAFHPYPFNTYDAVPVSVFIITALTISGFCYFIYRYRNSRGIIFGLAFFITTIFLVLQFLPVGLVVIAERYSYLSYFGLFYVIGYFIFNKEFYKHKKLFISLLIIFCVFCSIKTYSRVKIWNDSISLWGDVLKKYPGDETAFSHRINEYLGMRNYALAESDAVKALEYNPQKGESYNQYGYILMMQGKIDEAISVFNKGLSIDSSNFNLQMNKGVCYHNKEEYEAAIENYDKAILLKDDAALLYLNKGIIYTNFLLQYDLALENLRKVLSLNPSNKEALENIGIVYLKKGELEKSLLHFNNIIKENPANGRAFYLRSIVKKNMSNLTSAAADSVQAAALGYYVK